MIVTGLKEVLASFAKAAVTVGPRSTEATGQAAERIANNARSRVPVRTGALRDSIEVTRADEAYEVGPTEFYGRFVEYGTWKDAPQPFMGPATDQELPAWLKLLGNIGTDL